MSEDSHITPINCRRGEMVDTEASKASARKDMSVRVRPPVPTSQNLWAIQFEEDVKGKVKGWKDYLAGFLWAVEKLPDLAIRIRHNELTESDLFFLKDYCTHCYAFSKRRFRFVKQGPSKI